MSLIILVLTVLGALFYLLYRRGFPQPIAGIPCNNEAKKRFMGDYPEIKKHIESGQGYRDWLGKQAQRHNSPLVQVFLSPYSKPSVVLSDYREATDIITRRPKEFDRSSRTAATVRAIVPESLITMQITDPRFKGNKELVRDLMTPGFLNNISAPAIYEKCSSLVNLWRSKANIARGRPFEAFSDLHDSALDIIMAVTFGSNGTDVIRNHLRKLSFMKSIALIDNTDLPLEFPREDLPTDFQAVLTVKDTMRIGFSSPFPYTHIWLLKKFTRLGTSFAAKDQMIHDRIGDAVKRLRPSTKPSANLNEGAKCAMDYMIHRETSVASKEMRVPNFNSGRLRDELFLYIMGGHDTTATTLAWTVKTMADCPRPQETLRRHLQVVFNDAYKDRRQLTVTEILHTPAPYLDAFLEEALRYTHTISLLLRETLTDTHILGHPIPKGTTLIINTRSASFVEAGLDIPEHIRSPSSRETKGNTGVWDGDSIGKFEPLRWLRRKSGSSIVNEEVGDFSFREYEFNASAGPSLTLGAGPRGCAGRRLAYKELRMVLTMLVWNFCFDKCPQDLSSYDVTEYFTTVPNQCFVRLREAP